MFESLDPYCDDYHKIPTRDMQTKRSGIASSSSRVCFTPACLKPFPLVLQNHQIIKVIPLHLPPDDTSTERTVQIDGSSEQIEAAKQLFYELICEAIRISLTYYILFKTIRAAMGYTTLWMSKLEELYHRLICFCSLLPPEYIFDKEKMIQLWAAEEIFDDKCGRKMEVVANEFFGDFFKKNFIVQSRFDGTRRRMKYKVGNVVSTSSYASVQEDELSCINKEVQHLLLNVKKFDISTLRTLKRFDQLRTLLLFCQHGYSIKRVPYGLFPNVQHLRILDLHATNIYELPEDISCLSLLRYLDVSDTPLRLLPESIVSLEHLQTLKLENCSNFSGLPECTSKLVNLRHLDLDIVAQLTSMPVGMGKLTSLQTLEGFILGKGEGYGAGELKHLTDLCGSFCISRLENISSMEEAREVEMNNKHFSKLEFRWEGQQDDLDLAEEILECLQPHSSLEELRISSYDGSRLPAWMSNSYLSNIVSISLSECKRCDYLPSLGGLPSLKYLDFYHMNEVRAIDHHFCRQEGSQIGPAFRKLEELTIDGMPKLEKWIGVKNGDFPSLLQLYVKRCPKLGAIPMLSVIRRLKILEICGCDELKSFPKGKLSSKLEWLVIMGCPLIKKRCCKRQGGDWSKIEHIPSIFIDHVDMSSTYEAK